MSDTPFSSKFANISQSEKNYPLYKECESRFLFGDTGIVSTDKLEIVCAGNVKHGDKYVIRPNVDYYGISFIAEGRVYYECENRKIVLSAGSILAHEPNSKFVMRIQNSDGCRKYFVLFKGSDAKNEIEKSGLIIGEPKYLQNPSFLQNIFEQIIDCAYFAHDTSKCLSSELLRTLFTTIRCDSTTADVVISDSYVHFLQCKKFIHMNFKHLNFVREIAEECHMNESYLSRFFKKHAKVSPLKYLTNLKIEYAKNLLIHRGMNVKATAEEVGFKDAYHFSKVFKSICGVSPKKFIEQFQKNLLLPKSDLK